MKLTKTKKIILLGVSIGVLTTAIAIPVVLINANKNNDQQKQNQKDVESVVKILEEKSKEEKIIILPSDAKDKIIANNQEKIIEKIKELIGEANLKKVKIKVSMNPDQNISTIPKKITIKLTKNKISKEIKDFSIKKQWIVEVNEDIAAIRDILDAKTNNDLIITLSRSSTGNIIGNTTNKNEIIKKLRILIEPSNKSGEANHSSLKGTLIDISMSADAAISIDFQDIIVSISKMGGRTLRTTKTFKVKKESTPDEDIAAIVEILDAKIGNDLIITLPNDTTGDISDNLIEIIKKLRILIDPSNTNGQANHWSLRGTRIDISIDIDILSKTPKYIDLLIVKSPGGSILIENKFQVKKLN